MCGKRLQQIPAEGGDPEGDELPGRTFAQGLVLVLALQRAEIGQDGHDHTVDGIVEQAERAPAAPERGPGPGRPVRLGAVRSGRRLEVTDSE